MNLYFKVKGAPSFARVDFPWQTPTKITYAVIEAPTTKEKLKILRDSISYWDSDIIEEKLEKVEKLLTSDVLELTFG
jgi:hypothetical protein